MQRILPEPHLCNGALEHSSLNRPCPSITMTERLTFLWCAQGLTCIQKLGTKTLLSLNGDRNHQPFLFIQLCFMHDGSQERQVNDRSVVKSELRLTLMCWKSYHNQLFFIFPLAFAFYFKICAFYSGRPWALEKPMHVIRERSHFVSWPSLRLLWWQNVIFSLRHMWMRQKKVDTRCIIR